MRVFGGRKAWALQDVDLQLVGLGILAPSVRCRYDDFNNWTHKVLHQEVGDTMGSSAHGWSDSAKFVELLDLTKPLARDSL